MQVFHGRHIKSLFVCAAFPTHPRPAYTFSILLLGLGSSYQYQFLWTEINWPPSLGLAKGIISSTSSALCSFWGVCVCVHCSLHPTLRILARRSFLSSRKQWVLSMSWSLSDCPHHEPPAPAFLSEARPVWLYSVQSVWHFPGGKALAQTTWLHWLPSIPQISVPASFAHLFEHNALMSGSLPMSSSIPRIVFGTL